MQRLAPPALRLCYTCQHRAPAILWSPFLGLLNLTPELLIANLIAVLLGMTIHEFAHCYVADLMGDPTPRSLGRLTLNPFVHIHWIGFLMFAILGFGILGSAPISPWRMRNPRWGSLAAVAAGPLSNLLLAFVAAIVFRLVFSSATIGFQRGGLSSLPIIILYQLVSINVLLFVFNLIPLFPLDGWRIVLSLLPPDLADWWQRNQQTSQYIFFGLILLSFVPLRGIPNILGILVGGPTTSIVRLLLGV
jgi:Zn-dependent protease